VIYWLYNLCLLPFYPLLFAYTLWRRFLQKKSAASFRGQWGKVPREVRDALEPRDDSTLVVWLHAVSVGEVMAARPIARALKKVLSPCRIVLSCTTDTGFQTAQTALQKNEVDATIYFPLDLPLPVAQALNTIKPDVFLAVETELWPNFLHIARKRGITTFLVNGRVSDNLLKSSIRLKWLWRWIISNLDGILMRGELDAERMQQLCTLTGADERKALAPGDVKLDGVSSPEEQQALRRKWREILKIKDGELLWVCGSTHPTIEEGESSEEQIALRVFSVIAERFQLRLLIAPRHIERTTQIVAECAKVADVAVRSDIDNATANSIIVLDTVGELSEIYAAADVAFVGGSLVSRGGHNVLEPVLRGIPVLFGPHMQNFRAAAQFVENEKLGESVSNESTLQESLEFWLSNAQERAAIPERARRALAPHQGAAERIAQRVAKQLKSHRKN
jgi:3-deoxy-D-manno-octulosonic-acid transferase